MFKSIAFFYLFFYVMNATVIRKSPSQQLKISQSLTESQPGKMQLTPQIANFSLVGKSMNIDQLVGFPGVSNCYSDAYAIACDGQCYFLTNSLANSIAIVGSQSHEIVFFQGSQCTGAGSNYNFYPNTCYTNIPYTLSAICY